MCILVGVVMFLIWNLKVDPRIPEDVKCGVDYLMDYIFSGGGWSVLRYCWGCKSIVP